MDSTAEDVHALIPHLSELELACLICLVADKHFIVRASEDDLDVVEKELGSISAGTFGFSCSTLKCSKQTTLEDVSRAALEEETRMHGDAAPTASTVAFSSTRAPDRPPMSMSVNRLDERKTCNVIIARNLDLTERNVQIQALELLRSRRIYSRTAAHGTPKRFLFVALISHTAPGPPFLTPHLNDQFFILHDRTSQTASQAHSLHSSPSQTSLRSATSILHHRPPLRSSAFSHSYSHANPMITDAHLTHLSSLLSTVCPSAAISRYLHDIPTFLRLHRHVAGGVSALATRHLNLLCGILAVLQLRAKDSGAVAAADGLSGAQEKSLPPVITPTLAMLAANKVYGHRVEIVASAEAERSMQWGSEIGEVERNLKAASVQRVLDETVGGLSVPV